MAAYNIQRATFLSVGEDQDLAEDSFVQNFRQNLNSFLSECVFQTIEVNISDRVVDN